ncbi:MAG: hypothetical protein ACRDL5_05915 [Solirubrobacteraceae bacterium]
MLMLLAATNWPAPAQFVAGRVLRVHLATNLQTGCRFVAIGTPSGQSRPEPPTKPSTGHTSQPAAQPTSSPANHQPSQAAGQDLIEAQGVADVLGLSHRNTVSQYQRRYADMPRPVLDLGQGRVKPWRRAER